MALNVEIKARCSDIGGIRSILEEKGAEFRGIDHQTDTYFIVPRGRLKLREGNIENNLIHYERNDVSGPKASRVRLHEVAPSSRPDVKDILLNALGQDIVVQKEREIYFIDNIKIHLDSVMGLGTYLEIEAQSMEDDLGEDELYRQCTELIEEFGIEPGDMENESYSDLLMSKQDEDHIGGANGG